MSYIEFKAWGQIFAQFAPIVQYEDDNLSSNGHLTLAFWSSYKSSARRGRLRGVTLLAKLKNITQAYICLFLCLTILNT